jgi:hypothetical protein
MAMARSFIRTAKTRLPWLGGALTLAACSAPANEPFDTSREALSTPFANDKPAYDYFVGKGLTNFQGAAVVGNLDQESGVNPTISQFGGGPGRGIAQWSAGGRWDTTPGDNLVAFAAMQGLPTSSLTVQLGFIWYELETFSEYGLSKLRATTNVTDATTVFEDDFEGCVYANFPVCNLPQRITFAKNVLAAYGSDPVMRDGGVARDAGFSGDSAVASDTQSSGDGASITDEPTGDAAAGNAAAIDATTSPPSNDSAVPPIDGASQQMSEAGPSAARAEMDAGGCTLSPTGGSSRVGSWWIALGIVLARARRRQLHANR